MSKILFSLMTVFGLMMIISSCARDKGAVPLKPFANLPDSCTSNISFSKQIMPIITTNCAIRGCHVSGSIKPDDFTLPATVIADAEKSAEVLSPMTLHCLRL